MIRYIALLSLITIALHAHADDPPLEGAPLMNRTNGAPHYAHHTNSPPTPRGVQHLESLVTPPGTPPSATNAPLPIYVISEVFAVRTPAGEFHFVSQADMENLVKRFGPATRLTNFVIYAPSH